MRGAAVPVEESAAVGGGKAVAAIESANFRMRCMKRSIVLIAWSRTSFSLSIKQGQILGNIRFAQSSSLNVSEVAASAIKAAFRA